MSSYEKVVNMVRDDTTLLQERPRNFAEVVRQRELGIPDYVTNGDFLDAFYAAPANERQSFLDVEPPASSCPSVTEHSRVLFAATAESLAHTYNLNVPGWVSKRHYFLQEPDIAGYKPGELSDKLVLLIKQETPKEFAKRNLFVSANVLSRA